MPSGPSTSAPGTVPYGAQPPYAPAGALPSAFLAFAAGPGAPPPHPLASPAGSGPLGPPPSSAAAAALPQHGGGGAGGRGLASASAPLRPGDLRDLCDAVLTDTGAAPGVKRRAVALKEALAAWELAPRGIAELAGGQL